MEGKTAVAAVVLNRWRRPGWWTRNKGDGIPDNTVQAACRHPYQFTCWLESDPNRKKLLAVGFDDRIFLDCIEAAVRAIAGEDPTGGATHYFADYFGPPGWAEGKTPCRVIGRHRFFVGID